MRLRYAAGFFWVVSLAAQTDLPPQVALLGRIRQHMQERLQQVPNYTCLETVERSQQASSAARFKPVDTVRIEVAEVDGHELFARPGQKFAEANSAVFAKGGFMANGLFAQHSKALFLDDAARFTYAGEDEINGRKLVRYDYQVGQAVSGYRIVVGMRTAVVAYHGSFWSDPKTLDTFHFRLIPENIPPELGVEDAGVEVDYQSLKIRGADALLPKRADMIVTEASGVRLRNLTTFSNCRHYGSESVLTFDTPKP